MKNVIGCVAGLAFGAPPVVVAERPALSDVPREAPDDAYMPRPDIVPEPTRPGLAAGLDFGNQVNVDALGDNIPGDAANEPSIAVDPTAPNRIVIGWRQFDTILSNFRQAGWAYSHDGGRTWTFPGTIETGIFRSDPVLEADADGTIYYCSLRGDFTVHFFKSVDGGVTWATALPPVQIIGGDKQWFTIDRSGGIGHGNVYITWNPAFGCCGPNMFTRSSDGAQSFIAPIPLFATPTWGQLAVASDGTLSVAGLASSSLVAYLASSNAQDDQQTPVFDVQTPVDIGGTVSFGGIPNPGGLVGQVSHAVDTSGGPTHGNIYVLASADPPTSDPLDVMFTRSIDGGLTFEPPIRINDDSEGTDAWQWFGTLSVAPNGRIDVIWNDTRNSVFHDTSELYYSFSSDGGASWSPNTALSPSWNSLIGWPNQEKIGDYYDMVSDKVGAHLAYAATFNGEQDVYYLRIGDYDCNGNGVADPDDITNLTSGDCNANGIPDECEIAAGTETDGNGNGVPDSCEPCPWDCDGSNDGVVSVTDLLALLAQYDPLSPADCTGGACDYNGDGCVDVVDLLKLLAHYDPAGVGCP